MKLGLRLLCWPYQVLLMLNWKLQAGQEEVHQLIVLVQKNEREVVGKAARQNPKQKLQKWQKNVSLVASMREGDLEHQKPGGTWGATRFRPLVLQNSAVTFGHQPGPLERAKRYRPLERALRVRRNEAGPTVSFVG